MGGLGKQAKGGDSTWVDGRMARRLCNAFAAVPAPSRVMDFPASPLLDLTAGASPTSSCLAVAFGRTAKATNEEKGLTGPWDGARLRRCACGLHIVWWWGK